MKFQNEDDDDLKGRHFPRNVDSTTEIMERAEMRKKFLLRAMKASHLSSLR